MSYELQSKSWIDKNKAELVNALQRKVLPHALILYGSHLSGQDELGKWLAQTILCQNNPSSTTFCGHCKSCKLVQSSSHPDFQVIDYDDKNIGVDAVRKAGGFLQKTAQLDGCKVVLISAVELLTESAANALLKTLEEPTDNSYLILVSNDIDILLPTITSRCSPVKIQAPTGMQLRTLSAASQLITPFSNINQFAEMSDDWVQQSFIEFEQLLLSWLTDFDHETELLQELTNNQHALRWLTSGFHQLIRMQSGWQHELSTHTLHNIINRYSLQQLWQTLNLITHATKQLKRLTQANKAFTIEALLVDIEQALTANQ